MLKKIQLQLFTTFSFLLLTFIGTAQTFPVTISTQLTLPTPIYLSNYADATTINSPIKVQLILNDLSITNRQVRLKCYFQGNGVSFLTNDFVVGARPLHLEGGFPLQLTNIDLAPYFQFQNIQGINPNQYAQALPEGVYTFSVEVYDFATGKKLSRKTSVTTIIFQNDPPFLNLPLNNASIMQQNIQNIVFSWSPRQKNVSNVEYEFALVEIWDKYTPVQNAFAYSPPLYTSTTRTTTLQYSLSEPQLIPGRRYAWRIKAKALANAEEVGVFKNNGYSEIYSFTYEIFCTAPLAIETTGINQDQAKITWSGDIANYDYEVNYREKNASSEWYKLVTPREYATISNLKPNTTYEYTVGASCDLGKYTYSNIKEFTTMASDEIAFASCGIKPDPNDLANKNPLPNLFPNDVVTAGDFPIVVLHSTGSNGTFSGDGYVTFPFLEKFRKLIDAADVLGGEKTNIGEFSRVRITFNNIGVNTDFKLISGEIIASYDADNWNKMLDGDKLIDGILGNNGKPVEGKLDYEAISVELNPNGSTTITGANGQISIIDKSVYDQVYTDSKGNKVNIPANGQGEPTIGAPAEGGKATSANTSGMSSGSEITQISSPDVTIIFEDGSNSKYAFDKFPDKGSEKLNNTYETIPMQAGKVYKVNYKAVSDLNGTDLIIAEASFKNGKTKDDIIFKTNTGGKVDIKWISDTKAEITLTKTLNFSKESIVATVKGTKEKDPKDATKTIDGKSAIAGKVNIWQLTQKSINLKVISINNASITNVESDLNAIYNKAGVKFNVATQNINLPASYYPKNTIECGDSGWLAQYTAEQQAIIAYIKTQITYEKDSYYVLVTNIPSSKGLAGFMPLKRQFGFIFSKATNKEEEKGSTVKTIAHELGHGVFGLQHPFAEYKTTSPTYLLMDYGTGTEFSHNDWQVLHAPGLQLYLFQGDEAGEYETDGHYSTVYLVSLILGMDNEKAKKLAEATEAPDTDVHSETQFELDDTWSYPEYQESIHSLTGGFHGTEEFLTAIQFIYTPKNNLQKLGELLHRFGDTYAHTKLDNLRPKNLNEYNLDKNPDKEKLAINQWKGKGSERLNDKIEPWILFFNYHLKKDGMHFFTNYKKQRNIFNGKTLKEALNYIYLVKDTDKYIMYGAKKNIIGLTTDHAFSDGSFPDQIYMRPNWYLDYVKNLSWLLSKKYNLKNSNFDIKLFEKMTNFAISNKCSLKGIIDYEIAKKLGKNKFYIPVLYSNPNRIAASFDAVKNSDYYQTALDIVDKTKLYISKDGIYKKVDINSIKDMSVKFNLKTGIFNTAAFEVNLKK